MQRTAFSSNSGFVRLAYFVLFATAAVGLWTLGVRFWKGLIVTHLTQHVPWGLWVALYVYFIGLSAGSFLLSTLIYVFRIKRFEAAGPLALFQALGCMLIALVFIFIDLGHPQRFLNVFIYWNRTSILAWECFFYSGYIAIILAELYIVLKPAMARKAREGQRGKSFYRFLARGDQPPDASWQHKAQRWLKILGIIGIPVAVGVHGGTGAIFAVAKARPNWFGGLFPTVFLVSALASGGALLTFLMAAFSKLPASRKKEIVISLARLTIGILVIDAFLLGSEVLVTFYGEIVHEEIGWYLTLFGPYWWVFWFVQLLGGMVIPMILVGHPRTGRSTFWLGLAALLVVIGVFGTRLNIVIPPLIQPAFNSLPQAYIHSRFGWGYFPSANELMVGVGMIAVGLLVFFVGWKLIPLEDGTNRESEVSSA